MIKDLLGTTVLSRKIVWKPDQGDQIAVPLIAHRCIWVVCVVVHKITPTI